MESLPLMAIVITLELDVRQFGGAKFIGEYAVSFCGRRFSC